MPDFPTEFERPTKRPRSGKRVPVGEQASVASSQRKKEDLSEKQSTTRSRKMSDHASLKASKR